MSVSVSPHTKESRKSTGNDKDSRYSMLRSSITHISLLIDALTAAHMLHSLTVSIVVHQTTMRGNCPFYGDAEGERGEDFIPERAAIPPLMLLCPVQRSGDEDENSSFDLQHHRSPRSMKGGMIEGQTKIRLPYLS